MLSWISLQNVGLDSLSAFFKTNHLSLSSFLFSNLFPSLQLLGIKGTVHPKIELESKWD